MEALKNIRKELISDYDSLNLDFGGKEIKPNKKTKQDDQFFSCGKMMIITKYINIIDKLLNVDKSRSDSEGK